MSVQTETPAGQALDWAAIGRGLLVALVLSVLLSLFSTLILHFSSLSERFLPWIAAAILLISVFCGSGLAAARAGKKGLLHGLGVGLGFLVLLLILGTLLFPDPLTLMGVLEKLLLAASAGALGGVLGVALAD